ncbi:MAG: hypothetical protein C4576_03675 [Desulfobacteraceae bacterium]|nr:MAG: hypothetical protein C4576_03675 [Desulfobacteraceae bacterium]
MRQCPKHGFAISRVPVEVITNGDAKEHLELFVESRPLHIADLTGRNCDEIAGAGFGEDAFGRDMVP